MKYQNYLQWLSGETKTEWWNDSGNLEDLDKAMNNGAVGVTTNPVLCAAALDKYPGEWAEDIKSILASQGNSAEKIEDLIGVVVKASAKKVFPVFEKSGGKTGYVCAQVNPSLAGNRDAMLKMAKKFSSFAPNISVKLPVTTAGLDVLEECAALGIHTTGTVSFTLPQMLAIADRHEAGIKRALASGIKPATCVAVIMIGRIDDYLREVVEDNKLKVSEDAVTKAGLAILKRANSLFIQRKYKAKICVAALRGIYHATEIAGADLILSIHPKYQTPLLEGKLAYEERIEAPVDSRYLEELKRIPEFIKAYEPEGMKPEDFITYGVTQKTLSQFTEAGWNELARILKKLS